MYFESVNCSANIGMMTFHTPWYRAKFGKLGMICIAGTPNIAKTNSLKVAMHMASSSNYFFSMKVGEPMTFNSTFIQYFRRPSQSVRGLAYLFPMMIMILLGR